MKSSNAKIITKKSEENINENVSNLWFGDDAIIIIKEITEFFYL